MTFGRNGPCLSRYTCRSLPPIWGGVATRANFLNCGSDMRRVGYIEWTLTDTHRITFELADLHLYRGAGFKYAAASRHKYMADWFRNLPVKWLRLNLLIRLEFSRVPNRCVSNWMDNQDDYIDWPRSWMFWRKRRLPRRCTMRKVKGWLFAVWKCPLIFL